jgi:SAM-dependent methyltransferase
MDPTAKPSPLRFDPRRQSLEQVVAKAGPPASVDAVLAGSVGRILEGQRNLEALSAVTALLPPRSGMNYARDALLHRATRRMNQAFRIGERVGTGPFGVVLDIGCGRGDNRLGLLERPEVAYIGLDIDPRHFPAPGASTAGARFVEASAHSIPLEEASVDMVVSFNALEHIPDPARVLAQVARILRPGGVFFTQFGPPWHAPFGPHLVRHTGLPHVHHVFPDAVVGEFVGRSDAYMTVNRLPLATYREALWTQPLLDCRHYWEYPTLDHEWMQPFFAPASAALPPDERTVHRVDACLVRR